MFIKQLLHCHSSYFTMLPSTHRGRLAHVPQLNRPSVVQVMTYSLFGAKHYLNHYQLMVKSTILNNLQWNCYKSTTIFRQDNTFKNMAAILSRPQYVNTITRCTYMYHESNSHVPKCICPISHNEPIKTATLKFLFWIAQCGIWDKYIVGFVRLVNWRNYSPFRGGKATTFVNSTCLTRS